MADVKLKNICKIYDSRGQNRRGVLAVNNFTMDIQDGEFIVFVGPSGCGKSTTLRMIAGLEDISSGDLYIDGKYVNDTPAKDRDIAMVFQNYALYPHMTAYQNISFGLTLQKVQEPVYEQNEEVSGALSFISESYKKLALVSRQNSSLERQIETLEKKNDTYVKAIEKNADKIQRLRYKGMHIDSVRTSVLKLEDRQKALKEAVDQARSQVDSRRDAITENKKRIEDLLRAIEEKKSDIKKFQVQRIDEKTINALKKSKTFYENLQLSDDKIRMQDEEQLKSLESELSAIDGKSDDEGILLKAEGLKDLIERYKEELDILAMRKDTIIQNIQRIEEQLSFFSTTPQPAYRTRHFTKAEIDTKVMRAAEILDIKKLLKRKPRDMSGGQRQRIALGRAIVREPKVFLLDEPLSNLDAKLRTSMRSEIVRLHEQLKTTFIYVTHDQVEAMTMGTRIVVMKDGVVQQIDTPVNLFDNPVNTFVAGFIGTPQMNMFQVEMQSDKSKVRFNFRDGTTLGFDVKNMRAIDEKYLDGEKHSVVLGVRCEDIYISESGKGFNCTVSGIELLGNETNIYTSIDGVNITMKLNYRPDIAAGNVISVGFNEKKLYLFDSETTNSILV